MLTRALYLAVGWFLLSMALTLTRGTRVKTGSSGQSLSWLASILLSGAGWALLTFGVPHEVVALTAVAALFGWWWIRRLPHWNALGQTTWSLSLLTVLLYLAYSFAVTAFTPLHPLAFLIALAFFFVELAALLLSLTFIFEALDVCCRIRWPRRDKPLPSASGFAPKVSLHVPTYNEPPELVASTLHALARLDYPNYEVLLVDNNTPDETTWRPLAAICRELGPRFRCLHLDQWPGYKSGALNFALTQTADDAEIVGIIDADYQVSPNYLRDLVPIFADSQIAFVQTPQDYRDYRGNPFLEASYNAYKYFFDVSMPVRNERNAIIFGGTMGLIRKSALQQIGGWDEWCITEDAEASLRILKQGYHSRFINKTYGQGVMPFTFEGLKKQRFRWCFGGVQILKKHWRALMPGAGWMDPDNRLTGQQRYFYLVGGLQWFADLLNLLFAAFLGLGALLLLSPLNVGIRPLTSLTLIVPTILLLTGLLRFVWVLRHSLKLSWREGALAMGNFFSLGWAVALGCIQGIIQPKGVFMRTPKSNSRSGVVRAVKAAQWETAIGVACASMGLIALVLRPGLHTLFLAGLLSWQAGLYLAAPFYSLVSIRGRMPTLLSSRPDIQAGEVREGWAARWVVALLLLLLLGVGFLSWLPQPEEPPRYAHLQPAEVSLKQVVGLDYVPFHERGRPPTAAPTLTPTNAPLPPPTATGTAAATAVNTAMPTTPALLPSPIPATETPPPAAAPPTPAPATSTLAPATSTLSPAPMPTATPLSLPTASPSPAPTATATPLSLPTASPSPAPAVTVTPPPLLTVTPSPTATDLPIPTIPAPAPTQTPAELPVPTQTVTSPAPTPPRP
jgi:cellulose synthase/poly-beta-1,6-N-acetylglucosamine synthase-like glycosyltransferase